MNGKLAKRMRAAARSITEGKPDVAYVLQKHRVKGVDKDGNEREYMTGQVRLHPECTRRVYKDMKQGKRSFSYLTDKDIERMYGKEALDALKSATTKPEASHAV